MGCVGSSSSTGGCVIMFYGSDVLLVVLSVRTPADLDISWTVSCLSKLLKASWSIFEVLGIVMSLHFFRLSLKISRRVFHMMFRS